MLESISNQQYRETYKAIASKKATQAEYQNAMLY